MRTLAYKPGEIRKLFRTVIAWPRPNEIETGSIVVVLHYPANYTETFVTVMTKNGIFDVSRELLKKFSLLVES